MPNKRLRMLFYWAATLLFVLPLTWSAILDFTEAPKMVATMTHLGYPIYFMKILGTAKLLGVAVILYGRFPRLKEWAYAGFTFDLIGGILVTPQLRRSYIHCGRSSMLPRSFGAFVSELETTRTGSQSNPKDSKTVLGRGARRFNICNRRPNLKKEQ